ncbi:MAG: MFS transporter [Egibacteraceae bacterium]
MATEEDGPAASVADGVTASDAETDPRGRWSALAVLSVATLLAMTTWFSASAVLPQLRAEWQLTSNQASLLTIAVQLGFVAGALLSAVFNLADILPPRRLMLLGALGAAAANGLLVVVDRPVPGLVLRFVTGAFLAGVYPPSLKAMATWFQRGRGTALGVMVGALTVGSALPHLVNGFGGLRWQTVILITSLLTLAGGLIAEVVGRDGPFPFASARFDPRRAGVVFTDRGVRLASVGYFGHMWELYAMWTWFATFFADVLIAHGRSEPQQSAALATFSVIGIGAAGCVVGGILSDRWGRTRAAGLAMVASGSCAVIIGFLWAAPPAVVLVIGLIWGFWVVADSAQFSTIVTEVADQASVGTAVTLQLAIGFTLTVVTIWLVPVLRDNFTWQWSFAFLAPGPLLGTLAMMRLLRSPEAAQIAGGRG